MINSDNIKSIFERLIKGRLTKKDVHILRDAIDSNTNQDVIQIGNKYAVNIGNSTGSINLGDNITYQGVDAETIREILRSLRDIQKQKPLVSNGEILSILRRKYPSLELGRGRFYLPILVLASWLIISLIISILISKYQPNSTVIILKTFLVFLGYGMQLYYPIIGCVLMFNYHIRSKFVFLLIFPVIVWLLLNTYCTLVEYILISGRIFATANFINLVLIVFIAYAVLAYLGNLLAGRFHISFTGLMDRWLIWSFSPFITVFRLHFYLFLLVGHIFRFGA
ncbi:hypothetical protein F7734_26905 [Scytonema sp. UIC 10036]|uniref:hypothetical protein n=1 Tax=Scytonema sp. UIC 10036 TaxID=2304196 RepID=UPI0012DA918C|nr:hypothetical protein [Scytonema sp. UIC 10036]MUG95789.1 hypothetical protein [Scytonema sp. UIC 10036]